MIFYLRTNKSDFPKKDDTGLANLFHREFGTHLDLKLNPLRKELSPENTAEFIVPVLEQLVKELTAQNIAVEDRIVRNACIPLTTIKILEGELSRKSEIKECEDYVFRIEVKQKVRVNGADIEWDFGKEQELLFVRFSKIIPRNRIYFASNDRETFLATLQALIMRLPQMESLDIQYFRVEDR
ncbi:MAG: hypothetical protein WKF87_20210 [Chryseolinea sp.]